MEPVRLALVGCGGISHMHARGALAQPGAAKFVAVCDADTRRAEERGQMLSAPARSWEDILADASIEAVDLCLPHALHKDMAIAALAADKHVLLEKPFAKSLDEADEMIDAADGVGRLLMIAQCQRYEPAYQAMFRLVRDGAIGRLTLARADHHQNIRLPETHWLNDPAQAGGGVVIGSGIHRLDLLRWFCGEAKRVYCVMRAVPGRLDGQMESVATVSIEHAGGILSECVFHWACWSEPWFEMFYLYGTSGQAHNINGVHVCRSLEHTAPPKVEPVDVRATSAGVNDGFEGEILHFCQCVRQGREPLTSARDNRKTLALVMACYESARTGQPVMLS